jgi:LacI family gluconate utilization system Gnt-I transcriptional repressor
LAEAARGAVTLSDVAARAGVSINTVSRALRAPQTVRPRLRRQIELALEELNYVPNRLAGGLAGAQSSVVGVVVTSLFYSEFAAVVDTMQAELAAAGLHVMLGNSHYDPGEELRLIRALLSWRPAGMAIVGVDHHPRAAELLRASGVPVVEIWDSCDEPVDSMVGMDHPAIGRRQAEHLLARGYRRLAFLGSVREHDYRAQKRCRGYAAAVEACGQAPIVVASREGGHPDLGERLLEDLLERAPGVDGIVCNSDIIAMGVLRGLKARGRRVPEEVGVIGFGDNEAAVCLTPTLSSVRPPRAELGRASAAALLARIDAGPPTRLLLEAELVPRRSSAGPGGGGFLEEIDDA